MSTEIVTTSATIVRKDSAKTLDMYARTWSRGQDEDRNQLAQPWTGIEFEHVHYESGLMSKRITTVESTVVQTTQQLHAIEPQRVYPHAYDPSGITGPSLTLLNSAAEEASVATSEYSDGNLEGVASRMNFIAVLTAKAYPHTAFNPSLGATVSFIRRATLSADPSELTFPALMGLTKAIKKLANTPLLSLDDAAEIIDMLEGQGWRGEHHAVAQFVNALLNGGAEPISGVKVFEVPGARESVIN